jgi:hypothetical protein
VNNVYATSLFAEDLEVFAGISQQLDDTPMNLSVLQAGTREFHPW